MKQKCLFSAIFSAVLFVTALLFFALSPAAAFLTGEAAEIPYQLNHSDRIVIGTVTEIHPHYSYTLITINVEEWLYNPLPVKEIKIRTETGIGVWTEDQPEFSENEQALLMLRDREPEKAIFTVLAGFAGKRPVSDREEVLLEMEAMGLGPGNLSGNIPAREQQGGATNDSETQNLPFMGLPGVLASLLATAVYLKKRN